MVAPKVSVIMPVYNCERYLSQAIESILCQTFDHFELLVIDDGSTDDSFRIASSYRDPRVKVYQNVENEGIVATLNKGILLACGAYVAVMHGDDISLPNRFDVQSRLLDSHPEVSVVAAMTSLIDVSGKDAGYWAEDRATATFDQIRQQLPRSNCISHPSVMIRRDVCLSYPYNRKQHATEDYDLWLRLVADHHKIVKLDQILLKYRIHKKSLTFLSNQTEGEFKNLRTKTIFISEWIRQRKSITPFVLSVAQCLAGETFFTLVAYAKRCAFSFARKTLFVLGEGMAFLTSVRNPSAIFLFFPFYHVGGAERVHSDIVSAVSDKKPWVFFTDRSKNESFRHLFIGKGKVFEISGLLSNVFSKHVAAGFLSAVINRHDEAVVFGANSLFYYELLPHMKRKVKAVDLLHAFGGGLENVSLPHIERLDQRVVINPVTRLDLESQYLSNEIPVSKLDLISVFENKVDVPPEIPLKGAGSRLKIIYVGRGGAEKRVSIIGITARLCQGENVPAEFLLVGDVVSAVPDTLQQYCTFCGEIERYGDLINIYREADAILISSSSEGFPMVVMEAMAYGVVPLCTDVGGIAVHVRNGYNGFLVPGEGHEEDIARSFVSLIGMLCADRQLLAELSSAAYQYANARFSGAAFENNYRALFRCNSAEKRLSQ